MGPALGMVTLLIAGTAMAGPREPVPSRPWMLANRPIVSLRLHESIDAAMRPHLQLWAGRQVGGTLRFAQVFLARPDGALVYSRVRLHPLGHIMVIQYFDEKGTLLVEMADHTRDGAPPPTGVGDRVRLESAIRDFFLTRGYQPVPENGDNNDFISVGLLGAGRIERPDRETLLSFGYGMGARHRFLLSDSWCHAGPLTHAASGKGWAAFGFWIGTEQVDDLWATGEATSTKECAPCFEVVVVDLTGEEPRVRLHGQSRARLPEK